jgi:hypothetical protein
VYRSATGPGGAMVTPSGGIFSSPLGSGAVTGFGSPGTAIASPRAACT